MLVPFVKREFTEIVDFESRGTLTNIQSNRNALRNAAIAGVKELETLLEQRRESLHVRIRAERFPRTDLRQRMEVMTLTRVTMAWRRDLDGPIIYQVACSRVGGVPREGSLNRQSRLICSWCGGQ